MNAIDAMSCLVPEGGRLRLTTSFDGHATALLSVQDSGPGIPVEDRERIFDLCFFDKDKVWGCRIGARYLVYLGRKLRRQIAARPNPTPIAPLFDSQHQSAAPPPPGKVKT